MKTHIGGTAPREGNNGKKKTALRNRKQENQREVFCGTCRCHRKKKVKKKATQDSDQTEQSVEYGKTETSTPRTDTNDKTHKKRHKRDSLASSRDRVRPMTANVVCTVRCQDLHLCLLYQYGKSIADVSFYNFFVSFLSSVRCFFLPLSLVLLSHFSSLFPFSTMLRRRWLWIPFPSCLHGTMAQEQKRKKERCEGAVATPACDRRIQPN